jgi:hypothetical protein
MKYQFDYPFIREGRHIVALYPELNDKEKKSALKVWGKEITENGHELFSEYMKDKTPIFIGMGFSYNAEGKRETEEFWL